MKALFDMKLPDGKQEWAVFATQSTSLVRFLESAAQGKFGPPVISKIPYLNRLFKNDSSRNGPKK